MTTAPSPSTSITIGPRELDVLRRQPNPPLIVDVRSALEFEGEHIEGARLIPFEELGARLGDIPESADVVVVCRAGVRSLTAAEALGRAGRRARSLDGGMDGWRAARLPVREGRKRFPVDRQVQLIAGSMVLAGVVLGLSVSPWFLALSAFFGAGLVFAGATGTCGMALMLMRMPWNQLRLPGAGDAAGAPRA
jgi:rhodanese-related sulfurtransferase